MRWGGPDVNYVEGVVTLDGSPVEGVTVGFSPVDPAGMAAVGTTDANGVFSSVDRGRRAEGGALPGEYNVTFMKSARRGSLGGRSPGNAERSQLRPGRIGAIGAADDEGGGPDAVQQPGHIGRQGHGQRREE